VITVDGGRLSVRDVAAVAGGEPVALADDARARAAEAHDLAARTASERPVYGRTTGVGANKDVAVGRGEAAEHGFRILRSHATSAGPPRSDPRVRATMLVRLNQLAVGGSGARPEVLDALLTLLNSRVVPTVREHGGVGTGDLGALATIGLAMPGVEWTADDTLPFLSSNAATLADAALAVTDLWELAVAQIAVAATTFVAVAGQPEAFSATVDAVTPEPTSALVSHVMRAFTEGAPAPLRLQDPFAVRCLPQVHGLALGALTAVVDQVETAAATAAENPVVDRERGAVVSHGGFYAAYLTSALDSARLALADSAYQSLRRLGMLLDGQLTGLAPFLTDGTPGASGAMGLEYAAASALGDLRALATPAAAQDVVLSRGVEDGASFASLAARQALDAVPAYAVVVGCELVAATRALRLHRLTPPDDGWGAVVRTLTSSGEYVSDFADRDLTPDIERATLCLADLARLVSTSAAYSSP
jgi:histidine ammonia-lyase